MRNERSETINIVTVYNIYETFHYEFGILWLSKIANMAIDPEELQLQLEKELCEVNRDRLIKLRYFSLHRNLMILN